MLMSESFRNFLALCERAETVEAIARFRRSDLAASCRSKVEMSGLVELPRFGRQI
jgi:hypothetical protein